MKKIFFLMIVISGITTGCSAIYEKSNLEQRQEAKQSTPTETSCVEQKESSPAEIMVELPAELTNVEQLAFVGENPCVLADGTAYLYADGAWKAYAEEERLTRLYSGDEFCALTESGNLVTDAEFPEDYAEYPLTSAGVYDNAFRMLDELQDREVILVNGNIFNENPVCLLSDGSLLLFHAGKSLPITPPGTVTALSGHFLLTDAGAVYRIQFNEETEKVRVIAVADGGITAVSACATALRCAGICEDGTVEVWSDIDGELAGDLRNAENVQMGFQYCVALDQDGQVLFSSYNKEQETDMRQRLAKQGGRAVMIGCNYQRLAVLYENRRMVLLDF